MDIAAKATATGVRAIINKGVDYFRQKRIDALLTKLEQGDLDIDDPKIQSEAFLSTLINTADALQKASGHKKVNVLTELFISGVKSNRVETETDELHELLATIATLSERELVVLATCGEILPYSHASLDTSIVVRSSKELYDRLSASLNLSFEESISLVAGIQRTGFIVPKNQPQKYPLYTLSQKYRDLVTYIHLHNQL